LFAGTWGNGVWTAPLAALPVQLTRFTAQRNGSSVRLTWATASEVNNYGFFVQRRLSQEESFLTLANGFVPGHGTTTEPHEYTFSDTPPPSPMVQYRLRQVDLNGAETFTEPITVGPTSANEDEVAPHVFSLTDNYPNPFNPSTEVRFTVEKTGRATLEVFTTLGEKVATLHDDIAEAGKHHRVRFTATSSASGVYLYRLRCGGKTAIKKMLLVK
jgi:hypothetical protein